MKILRTSLILSSFIATLWISINIHHSETQKRILKDDYIELSKVKYGLFNVDQWKTILANIISKKVEDFNLSNNNKEEMRTKISNFLHTAIDEFEVNFQETNRKKSWFGLSLKNMLASSTSIFTRLREEVPNLTEQTITFLEDPENREKIKAYLIQKLNNYATETFTEMNYELHDKLLAKYEINNREDCLIIIKSIIKQITKQNKAFNYLLFGLILLQIINLVILKRTTKFEFTIYTALAIFLLFMGLLLPMIDIDALVQSMKFSLLGEPINFEDQVLFFKSKSILEVVTVMLAQGKPQLIGVGILVLLFSVIFPLFKIICTLLLVFRPKLKNLSIIHFMAFKSGKWSMADVMVIAIFMAYLGFSGVLSEQLNQLESITSTLDLLTTNQSELQVGFYLFTVFVLLSLFISSKLQQRIEILGQNHLKQSTYFQPQDVLLTIASRMLKKGFSFEDIEEMTGVTKQQLKEANS